MDVHRTSDGGNVPSWDGAATRHLLQQWVTATNVRGGKHNARQPCLSLLDCTIP